MSTVPWEVHTKNVTQGLIREVKKLTFHLRRPLTWDRGIKMAGHAKFTVATDVSIYFCDPQSPWQRGLHENSSGLLRQYFPKGTGLAHLSQPL
ncbi:MAG: IS30 family transposase [Deltaproteobacteria bacterium]|nr:MAG: IS30 family transposase [Deltaproteobacteria bacterium]